MGAGYIEVGRFLFFRTDSVRFFGASSLIKTGVCFYFFGVGIKCTLVHYFETKEIRILTNDLYSYCLDVCLPPT